MSPSNAEQAAPQAADARAAARTVRLRSVLLALVVVALAPAVGTAVFAIRQSADAHRQASASHLADTARALAHTIEAELSTKAALLQAMARGIGSDDIALAQAQSWLDGLHAGQGRFVLSVLDSVPGEAHAQLRTQHLPPAVVHDALVRGGVSLSNLFRQADASTPAVALSVPLPARLREQLLLSLVLPVEQLMSLAPQQLGADHSLLVAVTDGTGHLVARSRDSLRLAGQPVPDWHKLQGLGKPSGQFEATTAEGRRAVLSFETLAATPGWVVVIGEPLVAFDRTWQQPLAQLALGSGIGMLAALLVAAWLARAIARPVRDLARNAEAVAAASDGDVPPQALARPTAIAEFETLRHGIEGAQAALHARADAERRNAQALALNELRYRTLARTGAVVLWRSNPDGALSSADGWEMLTGEPDASALGMGWRQRVHPDDLQTMQAPSGQQQMDREFRIARADGSWCWVRGRGTAVPTGDGHMGEWVGVLEDVSERRAAQARIAHVALHDALTGLPNRVEFRNRLEATIRRAGRGDTSALLYIDLDRFKLVNDTLGHPAGDALLQAVAGRLCTLVRQDDTVARLSGDEFAIIQSRLASPSDAAGLASRVVQTLSAPYDITGQRVGIGASVGIMLVGDDSCDADHVLKYADMALYRAKQEGRGRHSFFEPEMDARMQARQCAEQELRAALERDGFELRYAPLVLAQGLGLAGVSATLYWAHPARGLLPDTEFVQMADELRLSGRLIAWSLTRLCADLSAWPECPKGTLDVSTAMRWGVDALCTWVDAALAHAALPARRLELEIGESALMACPETALRAVQALQARGVQVTLSRFGSGYATLEPLRQMRFDKIKVERGMLGAGQAGPLGMACMRAVALLCDELGMRMGADGVATDAQLQALPRAAGLELQGALFGEPCAAADLPDLLRALAAARR